MKNKLSFFWCVDRCCITKSWEEYVGITCWKSAWKFCKFDVEQISFNMRSPVPELYLARTLWCAFVWVRILISLLNHSKALCVCVCLCIKTVAYGKPNTVDSCGMEFQLRLIRTYTYVYTYKLVPYITSRRGLTAELLPLQLLCSPLLSVPAVVFSLSCTLAHAWPAMRYEDDDATRHRRQAQVKDLSATKLWHLRARLRQQRQQRQQAAVRWGKKLKLQQIIKINFNQGGQTKRWPAKSIAHFCAPK